MGERAVTNDPTRGVSLTLQSVNTQTPGVKAPGASFLALGAPGPTSQPARLGGGAAIAPLVRFIMNEWTVCAILMTAFYACVASRQ